jgi:ABC-2 type transport system permease protein
MPPTLKVAMWEIMRNLRSREFLIGLLLSPLILSVFWGGSWLLDRLNPPQRAVYYVIDHIEAFPQLQEAGDPGRLEFILFTGDPRAVAEQVKERGADGHLVLSEDFVQTGRLPVYSVRGTLASEAALLEAVDVLLWDHRAQLVGLDYQTQQWLVAPAVLVPVALDPGAADPGLRRARLAASGGLAIFLGILIYTTAAMLFTSTLQEKRTRMIEVLLSSIEPRHLLDGKVFGHSGLALVQAAAWIVPALLANHFHFRLPLGQLIDISSLPLIGFFALLGYLLFASMFVASGAIIPDLESAGNVQGTIMMLPLLNTIFVPPAIANPDGFVATLGTFFPITSPFVIMVRMGLTTIPMVELVAAAVLLIVSQVVVGRAAARVFRAGMLMYGKPASLKEIWRWIRTP